MLWKTNIILLCFVLCMRVSGNVLYPGIAPTDRMHLLGAYNVVKIWNIIAKFM